MSAPSIIWYSCTVILIIAIAAAAYISWKRRSEKLLKVFISNRWAKEPDSDIKIGELQSISSYFINKTGNIGDRDGNNSGGYRIDDITWNDLDMDKIFMRVNNTMSSVGEEYLYSLLREPVFESSILEQRNRLIEFFRENPHYRAKMQYHLARLGKVRSANISDFFYDSEEKLSERGSKYLLLALIPVFTIPVILINLNLGLFILIASVFTNVILYFKDKNNLELQMITLGYTVNLIMASKKILNLDIKEMEDHNRRLEKSYRTLKNAVRKFSYIVNKIPDPLMLFEMLKMIFLIDLIIFESTLKTLRLHKSELRDVYETVGLLDSLISIASYRESLSCYTKPVLNKAGGSYAKRLVFKDIYHPLIKNPVVNSIETGTSVLITGSNASGKSTFIKTAAINAIFAQTIFTCLAREYHSVYFIIFTSMALKDNLLNNESYYITEIKSLKRIVDSLNEDIPCLCLIDEVLRGTNTVERIAASSQVLHYLSVNNCLCFAATHDMELAAILRNYYDNYHFQEDFINNDIVFDYRLYPGKSNTKNAIKLLKLMGYKESIINKAEESANNFINKGIWAKI